MPVKAAVDLSLQIRSFLLSVEDVSNWLSGLRVAAQLGRNR